MADTTCPDCGTATVSHYARPRLCESCAKERAKQRIRAFKVANREKIRAAARIVIERDMTCQDCGAGFVRTGNRGPIPKWCADCRAARARASWRRLQGYVAPDERRCRDCDAVIGMAKRHYCPGCFLGHERLRKALRRGIEAAAAEKFNVQEIYERDRWRCGLCEKPVRRDVDSRHPLSPSLDHILPISLGGEHTRANVQLAHLRCNLAKGNRSRGEQLRLV